MLSKLLALTPLAAALAPSTSLPQDCPTPALVAPVGSGTPGTHGVPELGVLGSPLEGKPLAFEVGNGPAGALGFAFGGWTEAAVPLPAFGATAYLAPPYSVQAFALDSLGSSPALFDLPVVPALCGLEGFVQAVVVDPAATGGVAFTGAVKVRFAGPYTGPLFGELGLQAGSGASRIESADLDGDGTLDLVVLSDLAGTVSVFLGVGDGTFAPAVHHAVGVFPTALEVADLDGDLVPDLVVGDWSSDLGSILLGDGAGGFGPLQSFPAAKYTSDLLVDDFDGNGIPDLVTGHAGFLSGTGATLRLGTGGGSFSPPVTLATKAVRALASGDFDGDGTLDLILARDYFFNLTEICFYPGDGSGSFGPESCLALGGAVHDLVAEDLDADGDLDLLLAITGGSSSKLLAVLHGKGDGSFQGPWTFQLDEKAVRLELGHLDGDGILDVAAPLSLLGEVQTVMGLGDGTFAPGPSHQVGPAPIQVTLADFDGDGANDLAAPSSLTGQVAVLQGDGNGSFAWDPPTPVGDWPFTAVAGDLDGDGDEDLVVTNILTLDLAILLSLGDGTFAAPESLVLGGEPRGAALGDLDGDGNLDLAFADNAAAGVVVLLGLGDGSFTAPSLYPAGLATDVALVDLDRDGDLDLAVLRENAWSVATLLGNGDGTFAAAVPSDLLSKQTGTFGFALGDLDGDGLPDLAVNTGTKMFIPFQIWPNAHLDSFAVEVLHGVGDGTFAKVLTLEPLWGGAGTRGGPVEIEDLDGDGAADLVLTVDWYVGASPAVLQTGVVWYAGGSPAGLAPAQFRSANSLIEGPVLVRDLNGDARPDLALVTPDGNVTVLLGDGGGPALSFAPGGGFPAGGDPVALVSADVDGNGAPDIVIVNRGANAVTVLPSLLFD